MSKINNVSNIMPAQQDFEPAAPIKTALDNTIIQQPASNPTLKSGFVDARGKVKQADSITAKNFSDQLKSFSAKTSSSSATDSLSHTQRSGQVKVYDMPEAGPQPIYDAINRAHKTLDLSVYQLTDEGVNDALIAAAKRGVQVRVMLEPQTIGGGNNYQPESDLLKAAGIQVEATPPKYDAGRYVDHAKFMVIDGREMVFSTGNMKPSSMGKPMPDRPHPNKDFWVDDTRKESVSEAAQLFNADWNRTDSSGIKYQNLVVTPDNVNPKIMGMIDNAKHRLYIYNQEFYDQTIIDHLIAAKNRGVDVQILAAGTSGPSPAPNVKNLAAIKQLTDAGVKAVPYTKSYLHAKGIVSDNKAFLGSQNFSSGGLMYNREVGEIFDSKKIASQLADQFLADIKDPGKPPRMPKTPPTVDPSDTDTEND